MFSQRQDPEALKNATPARPDPLHKTKNVWFMHDENETVQDFVDSKIGFSPAKSMNSLQKLEPIQSRLHINTIRSPQNMQANLVDFVTHKKLNTPQHDHSFFNTKNQFRNQNKQFQLQQMLDDQFNTADHGGKQDSVFMNPNNTMTMGYA